MIEEKGTGSGEWKGERWIGGGIHVGVGSTTWVGATTASSRADGRPENQHSGYEEAFQTCKADVRLVCGMAKRETT